jgi:hypothetical protein
MPQTAGRAAGTRTPTQRLVVRPNNAQPMLLSHFTDAQMDGEDDVISRKQKKCVAVETCTAEDEVPLSAES